MQSNSSASAPHAGKNKHMIIGFMGKGGSGKSTVSHRFAAWCATEGMRVLAIDADHNMDLAARFGEAESGQYFGGTIEELLRAANAGRYEDIVTGKMLSFSTNPQDAYTARYARKISERIALMTAGPHTETILAGKSCSHSLFTPLKAYLPLLAQEPDGMTVVDCTAGTDSAGTGIVTGFDLGVICAEPTAWSVKAANQIADILETYGTPYVFLGNKTEGKEAAFTELKKTPIAYLPANAALANPAEETLPDAAQAAFGAIRTCASSLPDKRLERSIEKFRRGA